MPTFQFTSPEGKSYEIAGPDGATPEQAFNILQSQLQAPASVVPPLQEQPVEKTQEQVPSSGIQNLAKVLNKSGVPGAQIMGSILETPDNAKKFLSWIKEDPEKNIPDALLASGPIRFARGAASTPLAIGQMMDKAIENVPVVGPQLFSILKEIRGKIGLPQTASELIDVAEERTKQARVNRGEKPGSFDFAGFVGRMFDPAFLKLAQAIPLAKELPMVEKMLRSGAIGAFAGATTPVEGGDEDFATKKTVSTISGAAAGAAAPPLIALGKSGFKLVGDLVKIMSGDMGARSLARRYNVELLGPENAKKLGEQLIRGIPKEQRIPMDRPKASEVLAGTPGASALTRQEAITLSQPPAPVAMAEERVASQVELIKRAKDTLGERLGPIKDAIFSKINKTGGVNSDVITKGIIDLTKNKDVYANPYARKVVSLLGKEISGLRRPDGSIAPEALHKFRTTGINAHIDSLIKNVIDPSVKERAQSQAGHAAKLVKDVVDDAIVRSGGADWKRWLKIYSTQLGKIDKILERQEIKPLVKADITGGRNIAEGQKPEIVRMLSTPIVIANSILKTITSGKSGVEKRIDRIMAEQFLTPEKLGKELVKGAKQSMKPPSRLEAIIPGAAGAEAGKKITDKKRKQ